MAAVVALAGIALAALLMNFKEEKYETPDPTPPVPVTHDLIQKLLGVTQPALAKKLGKCVYPLETSYVRQDGDVFHCRFTFMVVDSYPYGITVSADVNGDQVTLEIQNESTIDKIDAFDQFMTGDQFKEATLPTVSQLNALQT